MCKGVVAVQYITCKTLNGIVSVGIILHSALLDTISVFSLCAQILVGELCAFFTKAEGTQEKTIVTADCCYFNPLLRRIIRFLGEHAGLYYTASLLFTGL